MAFIAQTLQQDPPLCSRFKKLGLAYAISMLAVGGTVNVSHAEVLTLEEIIVTATKKDETLADVAETVNVVTGDTLRNFNITNFQDIQNLTPGLTLKTLDERNQSITLRGAPYDPDSAARPTVVTYIDGIAVRSNVAFSQLFDIQRIEILRGPQGTLQGETSPSGSIQIYTKRANPDSVEGELRQSLDDSGTSVTEVAASYPLIEGKLGVRVAGVYQSSDLYDLESVNNGKNATSDSRSGRFNIHWLPTDELVVSLTYQYLERQTDGLEILEGSDAFSSSALFSNEHYSNTAPLGTGSPDLDAYDRKSLQTGESDVVLRNNLYNLTVDWEVMDHTITLLGGHQNNKNYANRDLDRANLFPGQNRDQFVDTDYDVTTAELRITNNSADIWEYVGGIYYENNDSMTVNFNKAVRGFDAMPGAYPPRQGDPGGYYARGSALDSAPDKLLFNTASSIPIRRETVAVFTDNKFYLTDETTLQVGVRWQTTNKSSKMTTKALGDIVSMAQGHPMLSDGDLFILPAGTPFPDGIPEDQQRDDNNTVTGSLKLSHDINNDWTVYGSYGRGYREGGFSISPEFGVDVELLKYDEESSDSFELGFKSRLENGRYQLNGAIYYQQFSDYITRARNIALDLQGDGTLDTSIIGGFNYNTDAIIRGAELEATGLLTANWLAYVALSYNDSKFDDGEVPCGSVLDAADAGSQMATCQSDGRLGAEPNWSINMSSEYTFPNVMAGADAYVRGLYRFVDNRDDDFAPVNSNLYDGYHLGGYGVWDLHLGLRAESNQWDVAFWVKNLFDKEAKTDLGFEETNSGQNFAALTNFPAFLASGASMSDTLSSGYSTVSIIPERTIGISVSYRFGIF